MRRAAAVTVLTVSALALGTSAMDSTGDSGGRPGQKLVVYLYVSIPVHHQNDHPCRERKKDDNPTGFFGRLSSVIKGSFDL